MLYIGLVGLYICAYVIFCNWSQVFSYFSYRLLGLRGYEGLYAFVAIGVMPLFGMTWRAAWVLIKSERLNIPSARRFSLPVVTVFCILALIWCYFQLTTYSRGSVFFFVAMPIIAYITTTIWVLRFIVFIQKHKLHENFPWYMFYKQFPLPNIISLCVTIILGVTGMGFLFLVASIRMQNSEALLSTLFVGLLWFPLLSVLAKHISLFAATKNAEFDKTKDSLIRAERLKTELITNVSHDIKTPLTSIINYAGLLNGQGLNDEEIRDYARVIHSKSLRLKSLIEDLIEASKAGTGNITIKFERINFCELVGQILGEYDEQFERGGLRVISTIPDFPINITADGRHLWRLMDNLFSNALKYSAPATRIYADLYITDEYAAFALKNISKEPLNISADELMEQFVRGDRARLTEGSGLGLFITRSLAEAMGARFEINIHGDLFETLLIFALKDPTRRQ